MSVRTSARSRPTRNAPHVITDPPSGHVVLLPAGGRLELRFSRRGPSRWRIEQLPGNLVALEEGGWAFSFLVFAHTHAASPPPLRLVRDLTGRPGSTEVREVRVVAAAP